MIDDDSIDCWFCYVGRAVEMFAEDGYSALVRKVIYDMQRIKASGISGDGWSFKTLWDEYCYEIQYGPHDMLESAWESSIDTLCYHVVEKLPRREAVLLTISAVWSDGESTNLELKGDLYTVPDLIQEKLQHLLAETAGERNISRFDPNVPKSSLR